MLVSNVILAEAIVSKLTLIDEEDTTIFSVKQLHKHKTQNTC